MNYSLAHSDLIHKAEEQSEIVSLNSLFWSSLFYTETHICEDYAIHLAPELGQIPILNAASLVRDVRALPTIEKFLKARRLDCSLFIDEYSPLTPQLLRRNGYACDEASSEVWRSLDLEGEILAPESFLKDSVRDLIDLQYAQFEYGPSPTLDAFLEISLTTNAIPFAKATIARNILQKANPDSVKLLLLNCEGQAAATIALGLFGPCAFLCLAGTQPQFRGRGFFPFLRLTAAQIARDHGCRTLYSTTELGNSISLAKGAATGSRPEFFQYFWSKKST